jgi:hypothetical protein
MKDATLDRPVTKSYRLTMRALMTEGFCLTNYGGGVVYYRHPNTGATAAVRQSTGRIIGRDGPRGESQVGRA